MWATVIIVATELATETPTAPDVGSLQPIDLRSTARLTSPGAFQEIEPVEIPEPFGARHSRRWTVRLGYGDDLSDTDFLLGGVGFSWFAADDLSLNFELNGLSVSQPGDDAFGVNLTMMIRWHFLARESWSLFGDAGVGFMWSSEDVPQDGSDFNFNPQLGLGGSISVADDVRLLLGARWYHISNGRVFRDNPGVDAIEFWAGLSFGF